jgi:hypothetical protein
VHKIRNFHERHSTVGEWQGSGRVVAGERQGNGMVCVKRPLTRQGNGMETAWERHGMCESAFSVPSALTSRTQFYYCASRLSKPYSIWLVRQQTS